MCFEKNIIFYCFLLNVIFLYSQEDYRCGHLSGSSSPLYFSETSDTIVPHTQKMILCNFDTILYKTPIYRSISITDFQKCNGNIISKIVLTEENDFVADDCTDYMYITLNDSIHINDIEYYDDTLYYCGYFKGLEKKGFVARISADKLFDNGIDSADYFIQVLKSTS